MVAETLKAFLATLGKVAAGLVITVVGLVAFISLATDALSPSGTVSAWLVLAACMMSGAIFIAPYLGLDAKTTARHLTWFAGNTRLKITILIVLLIIILDLLVLREHGPLMWQTASTLIWEGILIPVGMAVGAIALVGFVLAFMMALFTGVMVYPRFWAMVVRILGAVLPPLIFYGIPTVLLGILLWGAWLSL